MILRPLEPTPPAATEFLPVWRVIERIQRAPYGDCWMITQPSHAALSGDFAAGLKGANVPPLDPDLVRAIALHDAGWGVPDAQAIMQSRSVRQGCPRSFVACTPRDFVEAWEKSIEVAASSGPAGGYMVSRHFTRIAQQSAERLPERDRPTVARFLQKEAARQKELATKQDRGVQELDLLTEVLQFCDLLSLYVCCGARESVVFPEYFGSQLRVTVDGDTYKLDPPLLEPGSEFKVAALRHPATKEVSSQEIEIMIE